MTSKHAQRRRRPNSTGRNDPDVKFVQLHRWMLLSPAYRGLDVYGRALIVDLDLLFDGQNNGTIRCSVRDAAKLIEAGKNKAHNTLRTLHDRGFIFPTNEAEFLFTTGGTIATTWRLTWRPYQGQEPTKEFMHWRPNKSGFLKRKSRKRKRRARPSRSDGQFGLLLSGEHLEKQIEVPSKGTPCSSQRDAVRSDRPPTKDTCPSRRDEKGVIPIPTRPPTRDTYSIPSAARAARAIQRPSASASALGEGEGLGEGHTPELDALDAEYERAEREAIQIVDGEKHGPWKPGM